MSNNKKHYYCNGIRWRPEIGRRKLKESYSGYSECGTPSKKFIIKNDKILGYCEACAPRYLRPDDKIMGQAEAKVAEVIYG